MPLKFFFTILILVFIHSYSYAECESGDVFIEKHEICFSFKFEEGPHLNQRGERDLSHGIAVLYPSDKFRFQEEPYFYLWMKMPTHEHGGAPVVVEELGQGHYRISEILLREMPGQWFLRVILDPSALESYGEIPITPWKD